MLKVHNAGMRNGSGLLVAIVVVVLLGAGIFYFAQSPTTDVETPSTTTTQDKITFPVGGETFVPGETYRLTWDGNSNPTATTTQIFLIDTALQSQGMSVSVADRVYGIPDIGSYQYTIPASLPAGTYQFEIGTLTSENFQISSSSSTTSAAVGSY